MSSKKKPSELSLKLIRWLCKDELVEIVQGDLLEFYELHSESKFKKLKYWFQVINYLRPSTLKSLNTQNSVPMFVFNPLLAIRNLNRQRSSTLISIFGFTLGLVASFFLFFYIKTELSVDNFIKERSQLYRAVRTSDINGDPYVIGVTSGPYGPALLNDFPESIEYMTRAYPQSGLVSFGERKFFEDRLLFADANFFEVFSFPLVKGSANSVLANINSIVISLETARKYFGDQDPIGQTLEIDNEFSYIVSGVFDNQSVKSHLEFDMVLSIDFFNRFEWFSDWWNNGLFTYIKVPSTAQAEYLETQFPDFIKKYFPEDFKVGRQPVLTLEPLSDIYFNHETRYDRGVSHGNYASLMILIAVGIAILFIACFNYVNLSIAQSFMRAKEVGIRKVLGVHRMRMVLQFIGESSIVLFFSILLAIGICELINPLFINYFDVELEISWTDPVVPVFLVLLLVFALLTSGVYPALMLSSYKPISILRGRLSLGNNVGLRKGLVITQFAISIFLIIATILISLQNRYLNSKDLGFDQSAVILIDLNNSEIREHRAVFKDELLSNINISSVSTLSGEPGGFHDATVLQVEGIENEFRARTVFTDVDYLNALDVQLLAGRNFDAQLTGEDAGALIINKTAAQELGLAEEKLLGRSVTLPSFGFEGKLVGIVKDFHFASLKDQVEPLVVARGGWQRRLVVKTTQESLSETLMDVEETYKMFAPNFPMSYEFLDESLARLYENEMKQARIFSSFSLISIFLACLGIFGLAAYSAQRRQKELGIRKILGATVRQIIALISKEFVALVAVATLVAIPFAWTFINNWLDAYSYRIDILDHWFVFLIGGIIAVIIALFTITFKTYKAAVSKPTESIRNE